MSSPQGKYFSFSDDATGATRVGSMLSGTTAATGDGLAGVGAFAALPHPPDASQHSPVRARTASSPHVSPALRGLLPKTVSSPPPLSLNRRASMGSSMEERKQRERTASQDNEVKVPQAQRSVCGAPAAAWPYTPPSLTTRPGSSHGRCGCSPGSCACARRRLGWLHREAVVRGRPGLLWLLLRRHRASARVH